MTSTEKRFYEITEASSHYPGDALLFLYEQLGDFCVRRIEMKTKETTIYVPASKSLEIYPKRELLDILTPLTKALNEKWPVKKDRTIDGVWRQIWSLRIVRYYEWFDMYVNARHLDTSYRNALAANIIGLMDKNYLKNVLWDLHAGPAAARTYDIIDPTTNQLPSQFPIPRYLVLPINNRANYEKGTVLIIKEMSLFEKMSFEKISKIITARPIKVRKLLNVIKAIAKHTFDNKYKNIIERVEKDLDVPRILPQSNSKLVENRLGFEGIYLY